ANSPAPNPCSSSTACSTAWEKTWRRRSPLRESKGLNHKGHEGSQITDLLNYPNAQASSGFHGDQIRMAGLWNIAAQASFVGAVVVGEGDLLEIAARDRADHVQ